MGAPTGDQEVMEGLVSLIIKPIAEGARGFAGKPQLWAGRRVGQRVWWSPAAANLVLISQAWRRLTTLALSD